MTSRFNDVASEVDVVGSEKILESGAGINQACQPGAESGDRR
jgi:hypothetical protein